MAEVDTERDRFPSMRKVIDALPSQEDFPEGEVERVEIMCHASGDATWRVWTPRAEEPVGGYLSDTDLS